METLKLFILEIKQATDSRFGDCVAVYANKAIISGPSIGFKPYVDKDTYIFFIPDNIYITSPLIKLANNKKMWTPDMSDFTEHTIFDEDNKTFVKVYHLNTFYGMRIGSILGDSKKVHISEIKIVQLAQSYANYARFNYLIDDVNFKNYVKRMQINNSLFFSWLFDDEGLKGYSLTELSQVHKDSWKVFLNKLENASHDSFSVSNVPVPLPEFDVDDLP